MSKRPQQVDVFSIQDRRRRTTSRPWVVRWRVDGRHKSRSFRTRAEADRFRSLLVQAVTAGHRFDQRTCEPASWSEQRAAIDLSVFEWCRRWLAEQWPEWQPRTRRSAVEAISRFVPLAVVDDAPTPPPTLRRYLVTVRQRCAHPGTALLAFGVTLDTSAGATYAVQVLQPAFSI